jgi:non-homologous end joining protein Ku
VEDQHEAKLRETIDAKLKGEGIMPEKPEEPRGGNINDPMAALKRRLGQEAKPARAGSAGLPARKPGK